MKTKKQFHTVDALIASGESPLPLSVIPDYMGINLCAVEGIGWTKRADGQLASIEVRFVPEQEI